jgi:hypothetical protein
MNNDDALRYPIGKFTAQDRYTYDQVLTNIARIEALPAKIEAQFRSLSQEQLETPYRDGGWNGRQVIHHVADSHSNAYIRFKWTLTEDTPTIKAYEEKAWAETPEVRLDPSLSINLLIVLHIKWVAMLKLLKAEDLQRQFFHPESKTHQRLERIVALYAWHGEHHLGHLQLLAKK